METLQFLAFFYIYISIYSQISAAATDTLGVDQSLSDGQTLVSSGNTFELGFFTPVNSSNSKHRYLGIWYKNITLTVVWVANRDKPVTDSSGILTFSSDGNLVLLNGSNSVLWTTNLSTRADNPVAQLLWTGNFVLRSGAIANNNSNNSENVTSNLWRSFDHPCDTLLLGVNISRHKDLVSWKSLTDPARGEFSFSMVLGQLPYLEVRKGTVKQFRSGPWNGLLFSGLQYFWFNPVFRPSFSSEAEEGENLFKRLVLNPSGSFERLTWDNQTRAWKVLLSVPKDDCDRYGYCGANSICDPNKSPVCECLEGFRPKTKEDWDKFRRSGGCVKKTDWSCKGDGDDVGFLEIQKAKLPDVSSYWSSNALNLSDCRRLCMRNCSCTAYANSDFSEGGNGCILWFGELLDIKQLSDTGLQDLHVKLAASEIEAINKSKKKKNRHVALIVIILPVSLLMVILVMTSWFIIRYKRRKGRGEERAEDDLDLPLFSWTTIATATRNFSPANKIGEGGFGPVYKGKLVEGQEIAVKRLSKDSGQGITEFKNEVSSIAKLQHRNLVRLLGCCIQAEEKMLIYEYMRNESLDYFIFDKDRSNLLPWQKRLEIIMGIARGLLYLHEDSRLRIIHRDLKTSNILLDGELNPKISDFGMARILGGDQNEAKTKRVVGTYGYMSPEYALDGNFSTKSDVFSFGVVVLEIVSGKKNRGFGNSDDQHNLLGNAWMLWKEEKPMKLIDECLEGSYNPAEGLKCIQIGLLCVQQFSRHRPNMSSVVSMLSSEIVSLPQPILPGYFTECNYTHTSREESHSENGVTITLLAGR